MANNENKEYAVQFLRFLADENRMKSYIDEFGFLAPRQEIMQQQFKNDEEKGAFIDLYQNARIREISSNWPQISLTLSDTLREILVNEEDSQTILDKGAEKIESIGAEKNEKAKEESPADINTGIYHYGMYSACYFCTDIAGEIKDKYIREYEQSGRG